MQVCMHLHMSAGVHGGQGHLILPELELQKAVSYLKWVLEPSLGSLKSNQH